MTWTVSELKSSPSSEPFKLTWGANYYENIALNLMGMAHSRVCIRVLFPLCLVWYRSTAPQPGSVTVPEDWFCSLRALGEKANWLGTLVFCSCWSRTAIASSEAWDLTQRSLTLLQAAAIKTLHTKRHPLVELFLNIKSQAWHHLFITSSVRKESLSPYLFST